MRIGLVAPEFSRQRGGMEEYERQLAAMLRCTDDVVVYARLGREVPEIPVEQHALLTGEVRADVRRLAAVPAPDVWCTLNAGYVQMAPFLRAPLVAVFHGNDFLRPWIHASQPWAGRAERSRVLRPLAPLVRRVLARRTWVQGVRAAAGLIANSANTARLVREAFPRAAREVHVVPPGVADAFFQDAAPVEEREWEGLRLLTVSRLTRAAARKNVDGVLQALAVLGDLPVHYTVIGDGDDRPRLEALAGALGVADRVAFLGEVEEGVLRRAYREADLFVLAPVATREDVEGFGIVYLEAGAAGLPVLASRAGGAVDAVEDGVSGLVLDDSSPAAIAAGIRRFAAAREAFSPAAARAFAERHRWVHVAARVREVLAAAARPAHPAR